MEVLKLVTITAILLLITVDASREYRGNPIARWVSKIDAAGTDLTNAARGFAASLNRTQCTSLSILLYGATSVVPKFLQCSNSEAFAELIESFFGMYQKISQDLPPECYTSLFSSTTVVTTCYLSSMDLLMKNFENVPGNIMILFRTGANCLDGVLGALKGFFNYIMSGC